MTQSILSHEFDNGLVLLAEPMDSVESAAFSMLLPAGAAFDPTDRGGLATLTCEMVLRGCGSRDSRQFITDLENLGVQRGESVASAHVNLGGATIAKNLPATLRIYADLLRRPHLPEDQLDACRLMALQELRSIEDDPSHKVMLELKPALSRAVGSAERRGTTWFGSDFDRRHPAAFPAVFSAEWHDHRRGRPHRLAGAERSSGRVARRLAASAD